MISGGRFFMHTPRKGSYALMGIRGGAASRGRWRFPTRLNWTMIAVRLFHKNRQIKIQSAKLPQYVQIAYDKITAPIIVSNCLFGRTPLLAVRMRVTLFICVKLLGRRELKLLYIEQRVDDGIQIHIDSAPARRIEAAFRRIDKIHRQRQPGRICCRVKC